MKLLNMMDLITTYGLHRWILVSLEPDRIERSFYFTEKELFMDYAEDSSLPLIFSLSSEDLNYRFLSVLDVEDVGPVCTCDFYSVVMVTGCKCGGK